MISASWYCRHTQWGRVTGRTLDFGGSVEVALPNDPNPPKGDGVDLISAAGGAEAGAGAGAGAGAASFATPTPANGFAAGAGAAAAAGGVGVEGLPDKNPPAGGGVGTLAGAAAELPKKLGTGDLDGGGALGVVDPLLGGAPRPSENDFLGGGAAGVVDTSALASVDPKKLGTPDAATGAAAGVIGGGGALEVANENAGVVEAGAAGGAANGLLPLGLRDEADDEADDAVEGVGFRKLGVEVAATGLGASIRDSNEPAPLRVVLVASSAEGAPGRTNLILSSAPRSSSAGMSSSRAENRPEGPGVPLRELTAETCFLEVVDRARRADRAREVGSAEVTGA